jgi:hypothetical protein
MPSQIEFSISNIHLIILIFILILVHVRKRNPLTNGSIITADHEITKRKTNINQSLDSIDDNKLVRPYFLIRPQTILLLPNETGKFIEIDPIEKNFQII